MKSLKKPEMLKRGDKVAVVSLSSDAVWEDSLALRYKQAKRRLDQVFGLNAVEMEHTFAGTDYIYEHPEKRAEDLMNAFRDSQFKGIVACMGGTDIIRMLPYLDLDVISRHPKVFIGYSDTTIAHLICMKAGIAGIYGPSLLTDFAETAVIHPYTVEYTKKALFTGESIGEIKPAYEWTNISTSWDEQNAQERSYMKNRGYELLQGSGIATGRLLGGCLEMFDSLRGTELFPAIEDFNDSILFFDTSDKKPPVWFVETALRNYGRMGIYDRIKGIIWSKPYDEAYYEEYKSILSKIMKEFGKEDLPIMYNLSFGHTEPKFCVPYGALARINCDKEIFTILDPGAK